MENSKNNWLALFLCILAYTFAGTVSTLMSVYLPVAIPELLGNKVTESLLGEIGAYISAVFLYGWMIGGLLFGVWSDHIGRKKVLVFSTALYGFATVLCVFVPNQYALMGLRFFAGMGIGGVLLITTVYISEIWHAKNRPVILGILAIFFPVGIVATGSLNLLFTNWRQAFWLGIIPIIIALLIALLLPETTKWQTIKEDQIAKKSIFDLEHRSNLWMGTLIFGSVLIGLWGLFSWIPTWVQTLMPAGQDGQQERGISMMLLGIGGILGGILSGFLIKKMGNRKTLLLTFSGCFISCCLLFLTNTQFNAIIYFEMAFLALFFGISQGALSSYIPELFPTLIRATATGFCFNIGRFFTATAVFFVGSFVTAFGGFSNALLSFSLTFLLALALTFFSKEPVKIKLN
ncbi:MFS transporter [Flavobacterium granuli]|uniref:MFS family permease n=1 Tax=Flavobacterium granuli TaxID=280093 RepID=A0ABU1S2H0_9FLAO|nr:MFS transporter [Flavobacterium granuli]MDR6845213.1 MFS family permease [Flavobacterium granuli]